LILAHESRSVWGRKEKQEGLKIWRVGILGTFLYTPLAPTYPLWLKKALDQFRPEIIHAHLPNLSAFWLLLLKPQVPLVIHWHADVVPSKIDRRLLRAYRFYRPFEQALLKQARAIIVTSPPYLLSSRPLTPFRNKCHIIPLGLDSQRLYRPKPQEIALVQKKWPRLVLGVGRLTYYKGFEFLIEAIQAVEKTYLIIVGTGQQYNFLQKKIKKLKLQNRVFLSGSLSNKDLHLLLAACQVFCLPSIERTEAFGLVLLEAMAFGKPLVTTDIPGSGVSWVNQNRHSGLVVPIASPEALAEALHLLLNNPSLSESLGQNARQRFEQHFKIEIVSQKISHLYETIRG